MWHAGAKLAALTLLGGAGAAAIATSDDPSSNFKIGTMVSLRLIRDSITAATMAFGICSSSRICTVSSCDQVRSVFVKELGEPPEKNLIQFHWQVLLLHKFIAAKTHHGEKVAIKVVF
ncbi:uncharacterized protein LOC103698493 [Phoenix dactylifera]|uniref:Uncharacterized protein LOC103698493 n=1 Tax=Phoenix dactylifera TaxID=42345 RepID=A0A8B9A1A1_PHODC|nr:uncharacterized protein LOC103698493 [Phoenix dactylifera]